MITTVDWAKRACPSSPTPSKSVCLEYLPSIAIFCFIHPASMLRFT
jgi:hypothetical protein